ncbi:hypothetical protein B0H67DRAFT_551148 [Lasiosphaeris hirsuta]|uniref:Uncharacterized protein n=1 Tax=Lasiosphaeris hirsuta TaxID=260670 RepID=A0AA40E6C0_9PEZI|nr:hypothetical protein B0H67DRAFT_551148 [Lasiosphaeris hirsuta]
MPAKCQLSDPIFPRNEDQSYTIKSIEFDFFQPKYRCARLQEADTRCRRRNPTPRARTTAIDELASEDQTYPYLRIQGAKITERQYGRLKNTPAAIPVAMLLLPGLDPKTPSPRTPGRSTPKSASAKAKCTRTTPKPVKAGAPRPLR